MKKYNKKFAGKVIIITGGNKGLGEGIARHLAEEGAEGLVICGRDQKRGQIVEKALADIQANLFQRAIDFRAENTYEVENFGAFQEIMEAGRGFIYANWCGSADCEGEIQARTSATIRVIPMEGSEPTGQCVFCEKEGKYKVYFAKAY